MLDTAILNALAGLVTGVAFRSRTLLLVLSWILVESVALSFLDIRIAALSAVINLTTAQVGYFAGIFARGVLERGGYLQSSFGIGEL